MPVLGFFLLRAAASVCVAALTVSGPSVSAPSLRPVTALVPSVAFSGNSLAASGGISLTSLLAPSVVPEFSRTAEPRAAVEAAPSAEAAHQDAAARFDGAAIAAPADPEGWTRGRFLSAADKGELDYRFRPGGSGRAPTVFVGGLAVADSFESYFESRGAASDQYYLTLRAHPPSPWTPTRTLYENDARDLARMIVTAARASSAKAVELVVHSYGGLVFQRMLQLRRHPEVRQALNLLGRGRVVLLNTTTHYGDSEKVSGEENAVAARVLRAFIAWLDAGDAQAELMLASAHLNPALWPLVYPAVVSWRLQRAEAIALGTREVIAALRRHWSRPWAPALDPVRRRLLFAAEKNAEDGGWQEAVLRRSKDTSELEFTAKDVGVLRRQKIRLELAHAVSDQLIPWVSARLLFDMLGIKTPEALPAPGSTYADSDGLFRLRVEEGDHYLPLSRPEVVDQLLNP